jgi:hypothetical protein
MKKVRHVLTGTFCVILIIALGMAGLSLGEKSYTLAQVNEFLERDTQVLEWQLEKGGGVARSASAKGNWFERMNDYGRRIFSKADEAHYVFWTPHNMVEVYVQHRGGKVSGLDIAGPQADQAIKLIRSELDRKFPDLKYTVCDWYDESTQQVVPPNGP